MDNYRDTYCDMPQGVATKLPISIYWLHILLPSPLGAGTEGRLVNVTTHLHLLLMLRTYGAKLHHSIRLNGLVLKVTRGTALHHYAVMTLYVPPLPHAVSSKMTRALSEARLWQHKGPRSNLSIDSRLETWRYIGICEGRILEGR